MEGENPFAGLNLAVDPQGAAGVMAQAPLQPQAAAQPPPMVADVNQVVGPLVQAIVRGNQEIIAANENLERQRRYVDRVPSCDGEDVAALREWIKELTLVPVESRLEVLLQTARGTLLRAAQVYAEAHNPPQWEGMKAHILQSFVSQDHNRVLQSELRRMQRTPKETILTFVQRFVQLADIVYPQPDATQTENLIKWICLGLKDRDLVRRLLKQGRPANLGVLIDRVHRDCASDEAYREIYSDEAMEVGTVETTPLAAEVAALRQEMAALQVKTATPVKDERVEKRLKELADENAALRRALDSRKGSGSHAGLVCFRCGKTGHIRRACRTDIAALAGPGNGQTGAPM